MLVSSMPADHTFQAKMQKTFPLRLTRQKAKWPTRQALTRR